MRFFLFLALFMATLTACEKNSEPVVTLSPDKFDLHFIPYDQNQGTEDLSFVVDTDGAWGAESSADWIKLGTRKGSGKEKLAFRVSQNSLPESRKGYITVGSGFTRSVVEINQEAMQSVSLSASTYNYIGKHGGDFSFWCTTTSSDGIAFDSIGGIDEDWLRFKGHKYATELTFSVEPLVEGSQRSLLLKGCKYGWTFPVAPFTVTQTTEDDYLHTDADTFEFSAESKFMEVKIYCSSAWRVVGVQGAQWAELYSKAGLSSYYDLTGYYFKYIIGAQQNTTGVDRELQITFQAGSVEANLIKTITVIQKK